MRINLIILRNVLLGSLVVGLCNSVRLFTNYSNQLKEIFSLTQTNMQILGAVAEMSYNTGFPAGWLLAKCGSRVTMTSAMLMTSLGYALLWMSVAWCELFQNRFLVHCFIFFMIGFGSGSSLTTVYHTLSATVSHNHRGRALSSLSLFGGFVQITLSIIHGKLFSEESGETLGKIIENVTVTQTVTILDNVTMVTEQTSSGHTGYQCSVLRGFFVLLVAMVIVLDSLVVVFLVYKPNKPWKPWQQKPNNNYVMCDEKEMRLSEQTLKLQCTTRGCPASTEEKENDGASDVIVLSEDHSAVTLNSNKNNRVPDSETTPPELLCDTRTMIRTQNGSDEGKQDTTIDWAVTKDSESVVQDLKGLVLLKKLEFHLIVWPVVLQGGVQIAYTYSLAALITSFRLNEFSTMLLTLYFLCNTLTRIPVFFFIDRVRNKSVFLFIGAVSISISMLICILYGTNLALFTIGISLSSLTNACYWSAGPPLVSELFGTRYFGYNYGWLIFGYGMTALGLQTLAGYLYDQGIDTNVTRTCYGLNCFRVTFIVCLCLSIMAAVLSGFHLWVKGTMKNNLKTAKESSA